MMGLQPQPQPVRASRHTSSDAIIDVYDGQEPPNNRELSVWSVPPPAAALSRANSAPVAGTHLGDGPNFAPKISSSSNSSSSGSSNGCAGSKPVPDSPTSKSKYKNFYRQFWKVAKEDPEGAHEYAVTNLSTLPKKVGCVCVCI